MIKVLVYSDWFLPGFKAGGPIRSISNLVNGLGARIDFSLITSSYDLHSTTPYPNMQQDQWITNDNYKIYYHKPSLLSLFHRRKIILNKQYEVHYFNSMFSWHFTILPLLILKLFGGKNKCIVAPRGMLGEGSLAIKNNKKVMFLRISKVAGLFKNCCWHATSEEEASQIKKVFGNNQLITVVGNIPTSPGKNLGSLPPKKAGELKLVYSARIHPIKNLLLAIKAIIEVAKKGRGTIEFTIYGPNEDESYWEECELAISKAEDLKNLTISYKGALKFKEVQGVLLSNHVYILPTLHENFGHSIVEAMNCGLPVIISDKTPWRNLKNNGVGWDISNTDQPNFEEALLTCLALTNEEFMAKSKQVKLFAENNINAQSLLETTEKMFHQFKP